MKRLIFSAALLVISLCTAQAQKFALIDMEFILKHIPAYEQANQQMESLSRQWQSEIEAKSNEAKALYEAYQKEAASLSDAQRTQRRSRSGERKRGGRTAPEIFRPARRNDEETTRAYRSHPGPNLQRGKRNRHGAELRRCNRPRLGAKHDFCLSPHRYQQ